MRLPSDDGRLSTGQPMSVACYFAVEETANQRRHLVELVLERKMPGVEDMKLRIRQIAKVGVRTCFGKNLVVLAPDDQRRRFALAEELLKLGIERHIGPVVMEQVELNILVARPIQQR